MARLRVGDIEISGSNVQIGPNAPPPIQRPALPPTHGFLWLSHIPLSPMALVSTGAVTMLVGAVWVLMTHGPLGIDAYLTRGLFLIPLGAACFVVGGLKRYTAVSGTVIGTRRSDATTEAAIERLRTLLAKPDATHTIEWISRAVGWPADDVVRTLGWLKARDELVEDLDTASGQYFYVVVSSPTDLDARLRHL